MENVHYKKTKQTENQYSIYNNNSMLLDTVDLTLLVS